MVQTEGKIIMPFTHLLDSFLIHYLERFNDACFCVKLHDKTYTIGEGEPLFTVNVKNDISKKELLASAELALGEAYMRGDLDIEGDLFTALRVLLPHFSKDGVDRSALSKLFNVSTRKSAQKEQVSSHYDLGNDFFKLWLDKTMS